MDLNGISLVPFLSRDHYRKSNAVKKKNAGVEQKPTSIPDVGQRGGDTLQLASDMRDFNGPPRSILGKRASGHRLHGFSSCSRVLVFRYEENLMKKEAT